MRPEFDYVVSFEAVDTDTPQTYFRGEIGFHSLGLPLAERVRKILKPLEQEFVLYHQRGIRSIPRKLWRVQNDGTRTLVELPPNLVEEDTRWEKWKRRSWNFTFVGDSPSPF